MKEFRTLYADEIECRVARCTANGAQLLLYKDARCDMSILDESVGPMNWQRRHAEHRANLFCSVGINVNHLDPYAEPMWVWKEDAGAESNTEAEKGHASDSFKRACVNWGIGRELYTAPFIWIKGCTEKNDKGKFVCNETFSVAEIDYDEKRRICKLTITDRSGDVAYTFGQKAAKTTSKAKVSNMPICSRCGHEITPKKCGGKVYTAKDIAENSEKTYGRVLCWDCMTEVRASGDDQ